MLNSFSVEIKEYSVDHVYPRLTKFFPSSLETPHDSMDTLVNASDYLDPGEFKVSSGF